MYSGSESMPEGQIIKALAGFYYVQNGKQVITCRGRGRFRKDKTTPFVGDWVTYKAESPEEGYVLEIHERKNQLIRPPIVNIDQAFLVFSAREPNFRLYLLNRFLVLVEHHRIEPIIIITKTDLLTENELSKLKQELKPYEKIGYTIFYSSHQFVDQQLKERIPGKITTVAGQTGVGKSSLLNILAPDLDLKVGS